MSTTALIELGLRALISFRKPDQRRAAGAAPREIACGYSDVGIAREPRDAPGSKRRAAVGDLASVPQYRALPFSLRRRYVAASRDRSSRPSFLRSEQLVLPTS